MPQGSRVQPGSRAGSSIAVNLPRTTPQVRLAAHDLIRRSPHQALALLASEGHALPPQERSRLTRQAVYQLAASAQAAKNPAAALAQVRAARASLPQVVSGRPGTQPAYPHLGIVLAAMERRLETRVAREQLDSATRLARNGQWHQVHVVVYQHLGQPRPLPLARTARDSGQRLPDEVHTAFHEVLRVEGQLVLLDTVLSALKSAEQGELGPTLITLRGLDVSRLPASTQAPVRGLRGLTELQTAGAAGWMKPPDVGVLKQAVVELNAINAGSPLAGQLQQGLAVKAFLFGFPAEGRALFPENGSPEDAARVLSDVKALVRGKGEVATQTVQFALSPLLSTSGKIEDRLRALPGLIPWVRVASAEWQPRIRDTKPALTQEISRLQKTLFAQIKPPLEKEQQEARQQVLKRLEELHQKAREADRDDERLLARLEKQLWRKLTPAERALVWELRNEGKKPEEMIVDLKNLWPGPQLSPQAALATRLFLVPAGTASGIALRMPLDVAAALPLNEPLELAAKP